MAEISGNVQTELVANEYIVALRTTRVSAAQLGAQAQSMAAAAGAQITAVWGAALNGFAVKADAAALAKIRANPTVEYVAPVQVIRKIATQSPTPSWGLDRIDQHNLPLNTSYTYPTGGTVPHIYIIDTGILTTHNDFAGRIGASSNHITPTAPSGPAWTDCDGHGTHTSGTAGGTTYGVMKTAVIHAVRVLDCSGSGTSTSVISGINWVINNAVQPAVSNMSLGGSADTPIDNATNNMVAAGIVSAVAAGNSSANACNFSPARATNALTAGATTTTDARASYSNFGTCLDIFAPGSSITSDYIGSNNATAVASGTSMASPHVAGAAALYRSFNPTATAAQVATALINNATLNVVGSPGAGSPNRLLYMGFITGGQPPTNQNPVANFTSSCVPEGPTFECTLNGSSSTDPDGSVVAWNWQVPGRPNKSGVSVLYVLAAGTVNITLTVTDNNGGTNTKTQAITVGSPPPPPTNQPPVANFTYSCAPVGPAMECTFNGSTSSDPDGSIVSYRWTAPGRIAKTGVIITRDYLHGTTTSATLVVTDNKGATNSKTVTVVVP
ncbi:MAG TPA: S8 family serine peptidase [Gemmatimonadaceae bacterium]|jgi:subtilisin family serine protease